MKMRSRVIPLTDARGAPLVPEEDLNEPAPGSIVLTSGLTGTAWHRWASDGKWHSTTGVVARWAALITRHRNVVLVYEAEERTHEQARS